MSDARALSYHDVVLRHADIELLRGPHWLNDQVRAAADNITITTITLAAVAHRVRDSLRLDSVQRCSPEHQQDSCQPYNLLGVWIRIFASPQAILPPLSV
jgi:hypothetical protein